MKTSIIQEKSYLFSLRIINAYRQIIERQKEYTLSRQLLKSGTSIGANVEEALGGQSRKDFFMKLTIAYKEARETSYWLRLMRDTKFISDEASSSLLSDCEELIRIITAIQKTIRKTGN